MGGEGIPPYVVCGVKVLIFQMMLLLQASPIRPMKAV